MDRLLLVATGLALVTVALPLAPPAAAEPGAPGCAVHTPAPTSVVPDECYFTCAPGAFRVTVTGSWPGSGEVQCGGATAACTIRPLAVACTASGVAPAAVGGVCRVTGLGQIHVACASGT